LIDIGPECTEPAESQRERKVTCRGSHLTMVAMSPPMAAVFSGAKSGIESVARDVGVPVDESS
jgi:hypothetical protein